MRAGRVLCGFIVFFHAGIVLAERPLGIDTSSWCPLSQSEWNAIYASGRVFGWTRASYGWGGTDGELHRHMSRATAAGLIMGVYHFSYPGYTTGNTPVNEANTLINIGQQYIAPGYLRPVLDVEYNSGSHMTMSLSQWCVQFLNHFEQQTGVRPLIYSGQYFARDNLNSSVTSWPYWIAVWPANPNVQTGSPGFTTPWSTWAFWQYAGDVPITGVTTQKVDLNVFNGTFQQMQTYVIPGGANPPTIQQHPASTIVTPGGSASFFVGASGSGTLSYQWQKNLANLSNGGHYSGATTATLAISNCDSNDAASYRCMVSNAYGSATSNAATLTLGTAPTDFIVESRPGGKNYGNYSETGTWGDNTGFKSSAPGCTPGIGHRWCTLGTTPVAATFTFTPSIGGTYEVFTTNCTTSNSGNPLMHKVAHSEGVAGVGVCQNTTCEINAVNNWFSLGQYVLNAGTNYSVILDGSTSAGSATAGNAGRSDAIRWLLVSAHTCVDPLFTNGDFETGSAGDPPTGWTTYIQPAKSGRWSLENVTPPQGGQYQQTQVYDSNNWGGIRQNVTGLTAGSVYTISGTYRTNSTSATASVRYNLTGDSNRTNATTLVSTSSSSWVSFGGTVTATGPAMMLFLDHLNGSSSNKASAFDAVSVSMTGCTPPAVPSITQQPVAQHACPGSNVSFSVAATGEGPLHYQWQKNSSNLADDGHYSGTSSVMLTLTGADTNDVASYRCVVSNAGGSATSQEAALTLKPTIVADLDGDCDVDLADFDLFAACCLGPSVSPAPGCERSDLDGDNDVDQSDFGILQRCFSGENIPGDPDCAN